MLYYRSTSLDFTNLPGELAATGMSRIIIHMLRLWLRWENLSKR